MQLMSWMLSRLGSRFSLFFDPYQRRVMHSALGRFLDQPLDLMVGLVEPDGRERVLPFSQRGALLSWPEQFERINSITFRGYSEQHRLRFEFNVHGVFYPQDEALCTTPAFYLEMRVSPAGAVGDAPDPGPTPERVRLFIRLRRPGTDIRATCAGGIGRVELDYRNGLGPLPGDAQVNVRERIVSLNPGCVVDDDGAGLGLDLPVTAEGSGIKWRLVWAAHCGEPVMPAGCMSRPGRFRYAGRLPDLEAVVDEAIQRRDDRLAHSRRFEKLFDQAPLRMGQRHLIHQGFQTFLSNTWWCDPVPGDSPAADGPQWFGLWEGRRLRNAAADVQYRVSPWYLTLWPGLLDLQISQWAACARAHPRSGGLCMDPDMGAGTDAADATRAEALSVEENASFLLLLQAYAHWTGDLRPARRHAELVEGLVRCLLWADRDQTGFADEGARSPVDDASPALRLARKQTSLAIKRLVALRAGADLLHRVERPEWVERCEQVVEAGTDLIESAAWLDDHYAVCCDPSTIGLVDDRTAEPLPYGNVSGWDAYSIHTAEGLLLPAMVGQPWLLEVEHLRMDLVNATRETLGPYGSGHTSVEVERVRISQNLWRDHLACYLGLGRPHLGQRYWDLQAVSNTADRAQAFTDAPMTSELAFHPRGAVAIGFLLAQPRLVIDRLAPGGASVSVQPDRHEAQRWPLLPLADWQAGKVPVCVVDPRRGVFIENETDPVAVRRDDGAGEAVG